MVDEKELNKFMLTMNIIWFAMLFSLGLYLFLGLYAGRTSKSSISADSFENLRIVLYALACIEWFVSNPVRKFILNREVKNPRKTGSWKRAEFEKYSSAMITATAMSESIGIYGLVLYLLGHNVFDLYVLIAVSAAAMLRYRPKKEEVLSLVEAGQSI